MPPCLGFEIRTLRGVVIVSPCLRFEIRTLWQCSMERSLCHNAWDLKSVHSATFCGTVIVSGCAGFIILTIWHVPLEGHFMPDRAGFIICILCEEHWHNVLCVVYRILYRRHTVRMSFLIVCVDTQDVSVYFYIYVLVCLLVS